MRRALLLIATLLAGMICAQGYLPQRVEIAGALAPAQKTRFISVPAGTRILIRTLDPLDSSTQKAGTRFSATLETDLVARDMVVARRGTKVLGQLIAAKSAGRYKGSSQLTLELTDIVIRGRAYPLLTTAFEVKGQAEGKKTTRKILGGTGLGAIIGGIAGGGKGAAIGAVSGAATGTIVAGSKKGEQLFIPSESLIEFRLEQPASLPVPM